MLFDSPIYDEFVDSYDKNIFQILMDGLDQKSKIHEFTMYIINTIYDNIKIDILKIIEIQKLFYQEMIKVKFAEDMINVFDKLKLQYNKIVPYVFGMHYPYIMYMSIKRNDFYLLAAYHSAVRMSINSIHRLFIKMLHKFPFLSKIFHISIKNLELIFRITDEIENYDTEYDIFPIKHSSTFTYYYEFFCINGVFHYLFRRYDDLNNYVDRMKIDLEKYIKQHLFLMTHLAILDNRMDIIQYLYTFPDFEKNYFTSRKYYIQNTQFLNLSHLDHNSILLHLLNQNSQIHYNDIQTIWSTEIDLIINNKTMLFEIMKYPFLLDQLCPYDYDIYLYNILKQKHKYKLLSEFEDKLSRESKTTLQLNYIESMLLSVN